MGEDMVDAQEEHDDDADREDYEDAQREFASPAGSQSGDANDLLGEQQSNHLNHLYPMCLTSQRALSITQICVYCSVYGEGG